MAENPTIIFSIGTRIFKNAQSLNEPPQPLDCSTCSSSPRSLGYESRYNPKTRSCECVISNDSSLVDPPQSCDERAKEAGINNSNYRQGDDCCCSCPDSIKSDCESRGWRYIAPDQLSDGLFGGCKCDCREARRLDPNSFYIKEIQCPKFNGVPIWNESTCECDCEILPQFEGCREPYIVGANCQCVCPPDSIPENGCPELDGRQGVFSYAACECVYPCSPGLVAYACRSGGPYSETTLGCVEPCGQGEYLTPCDHKGFRHCCPNGSTWGINEKGIEECIICEKIQQTCDSPNQFNYKDCSCCPDGKIYDYGDNEFNLYDGECVCENVTDIYSDTTIDTNECVAPRFITDDCDCKCPNGLIWGPDPTSQGEYDCIDISDRCPEYDENGDPIGPVDENGFALYTRWDIYNLECECFKGNIDVNDCTEHDKFLNTNTCECDCPSGSSRLVLPDWNSEIEPWDTLECVCDENKVLNSFELSDWRTDECVTCQDIHGPNSVFVPNDDGIYNLRTLGKCECLPGFTKKKFILSDDSRRRECVSCENYTDNSVWNPETEKCECVDGFEKIGNDDNTDFDCVEIVTTTPTTPVP